MKRFFSFLMILGLAYCLAFPVYSMAGGSVNFQTKDGVNSSLSKPYSSFTIDGNGNITILYSGTNAEMGSLQTQPVITISSAGDPNTGVDNNTATVTGTKTAPVAFSVAATDTDFSATNGSTLTLTYIFPGGEEVSPFTLTAASIGTFTKAFSTGGVYHVIFKASFDPDGNGPLSPFETQRTITIAVDQQYTLGTSVSPAGAGSVSANPAATGGFYAPGTAVSLTASPASGYVFSNWSGDASGTVNPVSITMSGNKSVTANFTQQQQTCNSTVTAQASGTGGSIGGTNPVSTTCGSTVSFSGTLTSGGSITSVSEGSYTSNGLTWSWTGIAAPSTNGGSKTVTIYFSGGSSCMSSVTAQASGTGGSIGGTNPVSTTCGNTVSFTGTLTSGGSITSVSEGSYTTNGLTWSWTGIAAPTTSGGNKTVTIYFSTGTPPPGNCSTEDMSSQVRGAIALSRLNSSGYYGYDQANQTSIAGNTENWYVVDPTSVGATGTILKIHVISWAQGDALTGKYYTVNSNNCKIAGPYPMSNDNGWLRAGGMFSGSYPSGQKFLLDVKNSALFALTISAMWMIY
jgi:uncharacterized repeat protein (TIGR02543 family)